MQKKYNAKVEMDKYKARLVENGYSQRQCIDLNEVFAPIARWGTIKTILVVTSNQMWYVFQLDVKRAFVHGELSEDVYINQPIRYHKGKLEMVYKLKKVLYSLRQAPRAWYNKIDSYFYMDKFLK